MRVVCQNLRHGGGKRVQDLAGCFRELDADVFVLPEFRGTKPSLYLADMLARAGLGHQVSSVRADAPADNALLVASRWPLTVLDRPAFALPHRRVLVRVEAPEPFVLLGLYVPNRDEGTKWAFYEDVLRVLPLFAGEPSMLIGDLNTGRRKLDEEAPFFNAREDSWMQALEDAGWRDGFRALHREVRAWSWHEPRGKKGFRLDHAFLTDRLHAGLREVRYEWLKRDGARLSDHAALVVDLRDA